MLKVEYQRNHACFIHPDIFVKNNIFVYKLSDKRDSIVRLSHIFHSAIKRVSFRTAHSTLFLVGFIPKSK